MANQRALQKGTLILLLSAHFISIFSFIHGRYIDIKLRYAFLIPVELLQNRIGINETLYLIIINLMFIVAVFWLNDKILLDNSKKRYKKTISNKRQKAIDQKRQQQAKSNKQKLQNKLEQQKDKSETRLKEKKKSNKPKNPLLYFYFQIIWLLFIFIFLFALMEITIDTTFVEIPKYWFIWCAIPAGLSTTVLYFLFNMWIKVQKTEYR